MSTQPVGVILPPLGTAAPKQSFLKMLGSDLKKVWNWVASPKGQLAITTGETVLEDVYPPATGIINLVNSWFQKIIHAQAVAQQVGGTNEQKAAAVTQDMTPEVLAFAQQHGLSTPTADKIKAASDALVLFLNQFEMPVAGFIAAPATQAAPSPAPIPAL